MAKYLKAASALEYLEEFGSGTDSENDDESDLISSHSEEDSQDEDEEAVLAPVENSNRMVESLSAMLKMTRSMISLKKIRKELVM